MRKEIRMRQIVVSLAASLVAAVSFAKDIPAKPEWFENARFGVFCHWHIVYHIPGEDNNLN